MSVTNLSELNDFIQTVKKAQAVFATYTQEQVDKIFIAAARAAAAERIPLAQQAVEETGMGVVEDKVIKNLYSSEYVLNKYRHEKTCGVVAENKSFGTITMAEPMGIVCGIVPTTNPTSTAIFKALICLKTRNAIIFSAHPRAKKATIEAARIIRDAAVAAGAPKDIVGWIDEPSIELSNALMKHKDIAIILATGGPGMVSAAYSSGNPAIGVGPGNTPVVVDETADLKCTVASILASKTFDNGMICASEQAVIIDRSLYDQACQLFKDYGAHILNSKEIKAVRKIILNDKGGVSAEIVGQPAYKIAAMANVTVPVTTKILIGEVDVVDSSEPFAHEKLSPVLALYKSENFEDGVDIARRLVEMGGMGHTSVLYTNEAKNPDRILHFSRILQTCRILINQPAAHGGIGDIYNFDLAPSLTLGCGSWGKNSVSENVGPKHLLNKKVIAKRAENMLCQNIPSSIIFRRGSLPVALDNIVDQGAKRVFIVTDKFLYNNGYAKQIINRLEANGVVCEPFYNIESEPMLSVVKKGGETMQIFQPDTIIALGGGSSMDAAKLMWVVYEYPETKFNDLALRFMDITKRVCHFPELGKKAKLICVSTTSGTGSEVTPFAIVTDDTTGQKYPLADYALTPHMAIVDADLVMDLPQPLCASGGFLAITHALEAYASVLSSEFSDGQALHALSLLKTYLPGSYNEGAKNPVAREKVHMAATMSGIAFSQAFLGICQALTNKVGAAFTLSHGLVNAVLINNVIRYNATNKPTKMATFSQYKYPQALSRYAHVADHLGLTASSDKEEAKVEKLLRWLDNLKAELNIPASLKDLGIDEKDFLSKVDQLALDAFDDQCTGANPRYPLIPELKEVLLCSYYGKAYTE